MLSLALISCGSWWTCRYCWGYVTPIVHMGANWKE